MKNKPIEPHWRDFLKLCEGIKKPEQLDEFFELFLTSSEREELTLRYLIIKELLKGERTQREIAKYLKVSISKITRGSNYLKMMDDDFKKFLNHKMKQ
jgi:TrpR family transcriptional regulator, trp operon repressor